MNEQYDDDKNGFLNKEETKHFLKTNMNIGEDFSDDAFEEIFV